MKKIEVRGTYQSPKMVLDLKNGVIKILGRFTWLVRKSFIPALLVSFRIIVEFLNEEQG